MKPYKFNPYLDKTHVNQTKYDETLITKLFNVASEGDINKLREYIIENNTPLNHVNNLGNTLIHHIMLNNNITDNTRHELINYLFIHGVPLDKKNINGMTALHLACKYQYKNIVEYLLKYGCNPSSVDNNFMNAGHYAILSSVNKCVNDHKLSDIASSRTKNPRSEILDLISYIINKIKDKDYIKHITLTLSSESLRAMYNNTYTKYFYELNGKNNDRENTKIEISNKLYNDIVKDWTFFNPENIGLSKDDDNGLKLKDSYVFLNKNINNMIIDGYENINDIEDNFQKCLKEFKNKIDVYDNIYNQNPFKSLFISVVLLDKYISVNTLTGARDCSISGLLDHGKNLHGYFNSHGRYYESIITGYNEIKNNREIIYFNDHARYYKFKRKYNNQETINEYILTNDDPFGQIPTYIEIQNPLPPLVPIGGMEDYNGIIYYNYLNHYLNKIIRISDKIINIIDYIFLKINKKQYFIYPFIVNCYVYCINIIITLSFIIDVIKNNMRKTLLDLRNIVLESKKKVPLDHRYLFCYELIINKIIETESILETIVNNSDDIYISIRKIINNLNMLIEFSNSASAMEYIKCYHDNNDDNIINFVNNNINNLNTLNYKTIWEFIDKNLSGIDIHNQIEVINLKNKLIKKYIPVISVDNYFRFYGSVKKFDNLENKLIFRDDNCVNGYLLDFTKSGDLELEKNDEINSGNPLLIKSNPDLKGVIAHTDKYVIDRTSKAELSVRNKLDNHLDIIRFRLIKDLNEHLNTNKETELNKLFKEYTDEKIRKTMVYSLIGKTIDELFRNYIKLILKENCYNIINNIILKTDLSKPKPVDESKWQIYDNKYQFKFNINEIYDYIDKIKTENICITFPSELLKLNKNKNEYVVINNNYESFITEKNNCISIDINIIKLLKQYRCNFLQKDLSGLSPIFYAIDLNIPEIVNELIISNTDKIRNNNNINPLEYAKIIYDGMKILISNDLSICNAYSNKLIKSITNFDGYIPIYITNVYKMLICMYNNYIYSKNDVGFPFEKIKGYIIKNIIDKHYSELINNNNIIIKKSTNIDLTNKLTYENKLYENKIKTKLEFPEKATYINFNQLIGINDIYVYNLLWDEYLKSHVVNETNSHIYKTQKYDDFKRLIKYYDDILLPLIIEYDGTRYLNDNNHVLEQLVNIYSHIIGSNVCGSLFLIIKKLVLKQICENDNYYDLTKLKDYMIDKMPKLLVKNILKIYNKDNDDDENTYKNINDITSLIPSILISIGILEDSYVIKLINTNILPIYNDIFKIIITDMDVLITNYHKLILNLYNIIKIINMLGI